MDVARIKRYFWANKANKGKILFLLFHQISGSLLDLASGYLRYCDTSSSSNSTTSLFNPPKLKTLAKKLSSSNVSFLLVMLDTWL
ncbi:hypothetical protein F8M41_006613 [Gigaspora margarita]|uniref:Uncharacterized protein n=1 Tax=Gigaspora margarita TaxID=4874 RepID=A0A8H3X8U1_GIGMA|nr:hypothetical protein F8M41_006613 [Gigaspora margarita]